MKSAYELAMERLEKTSGPAKKLNDEQRAEIAQIEKLYEARIAETRLDFDQKVSAAASVVELEELQQQLGQKISELEQERDQKKEAVWEKA
jgi:superfamily I DNA and/or RNA helicase